MRRRYFFSGGGPSAPVYDPDSQAYLALVANDGGAVNDQLRALFDAFVEGCKTDNVFGAGWQDIDPLTNPSLLDAFYPMLGTTGMTVRHNLGNPVADYGAHMMQLFGGWTFSNGMQGDAVSTYARTFLTDANIQATTERWIGFGSLTDIQPSGPFVEMGKGSSQIVRAQARTSGGLLAVEMFSSQQTVAVADSLGRHLFYRDPVTTNVKALKNSSLIINNPAQPGGIIVNNEFLIGATNNTDTSAIVPAFRTGRKFSYALIGCKGISDARALSLHNRIQTLLTGLGR